MKFIFKSFLIILLSIIIIFGNNNIVFGYEDDIIKVDLPATYEIQRNSEGYTICDSKDENRGVIIFIQPDLALKKTFNQINKLEIDEIIQETYGSIGKIVESKRTILGEEKAFRYLINITNEGFFYDIYITYSNKYIYSIIFIEETVDELENQDYKMIKDSFNIKDRTTNPIILWIVLIAIIVGVNVIYIYIKIKKKKNKEKDNNI